MVPGRWKLAPRHPPPPRPQHHRHHARRQIRRSPLAHRPTVRKPHHPENLHVPQPRHPPPPLRRPQHADRKRPLHPRKTSRPQRRKRRPPRRHPLRRRREIQCPFILHPSSFILRPRPQKPAPAKQLLVHQADAENRKNPPTPRPHVPPRLPHGRRHHVRRPDL